MSDEIPRDPSFYYLTDHALQKSKHRNINFKQIATAIQNGDIIHKDKHDENCCRIKHKSYKKGQSLNVVVNYENGEVITVARN